MVYPVGSIYTNASDSTNPATLLGFGTWEAFASGRVMVGKASSGTFQTAGATMGAETHTLTTTEMPSHTHNIRYAGGAKGISLNGGGNWYGLSWNITGASTDELQPLNTGGGGSHNNIQPSIVVYMWKRTA